MQSAPKLTYLDGAHWDGSATAFGITSRDAEAVELCLFDAEGNETRTEMGLIEPYRFGVRLDGVSPGTRYGYRVHGQWNPTLGLRHNPAKLLIDPYARAIDGQVIPSPALAGHLLPDPSEPSPIDSAPYTLRSVVTSGAFDWQGVESPRLPLAESVLYETHVKGISMRHPEVPAELRGTYAGLAHEAVIRHLLELGVTTIELLPVHQFVQDQHLLQTGRRNYWGYNSLGFFAPHSEYTAGDDPVSEFKAMVRELHRAGIEVILDVVYNHTAEGNHLGPTLCYRGLDNRAWYRLEPGDPSRYLNWSGTGNTVNLGDPQVLTLVMDSMRYWVDDMHVDGFRFDLATVLGRGRDEFDPLSGFFGAVAQDPVLRGTKMIAEPWDLGPGGYRLGGFPRRWSEWNDKYRDVVRDFWRGSEGTLAGFASRITGSSDVFEGSGRTPTASVNYITSHDGYTLSDLVSFQRRHNHANGESNMDGHRDNRSWNTGVEGPTTKPSVIALRNRRRRSAMATVLLSQGVPMLLGGDEIGRTQRGNNNAYNQDNETSWYDWSSVDREMFEFARQVVTLRRSHPTFRRTAWLHEHAEPGEDHVGWYTPAGMEMTVGDWTAPFARSVALHLSGESVHTASGSIVDDDFLLLFNAYGEPLEFTIAPEIESTAWEVVLDTAATDIAGPERTGAVAVLGYGLMVMRRPR